MSEFFEPDEDDAYLNPCGPLGSNTSVSVAGKHLGEYSNDEEALEALREWMDRNEFWPNIWTISDHGNVHYVTFEGD